MDKKVCPVCKKKADKGLVDVCCSAYKTVMEMIKRAHPEWVEKDGACHQCVAYYKKL